MFFYKEIKKGKIISYQAFLYPVDADSLVAISESEYNAAIEELRAKAETEIEAAEQSKDERIAELEKENAALLFQMLTGEEYTDV